MGNTLTEALTSQFATKAELAELQKTLTTASGSGGALVPDIFDPDIVSDIVYESTFLSRMQTQGNIQPHRSKNVGYRYKKTGVATSAIGEDDNIPAGTDSTYDKDVGSMTTYVTPVNISLMEKMGTQDVTDVYNDEVQDAILDHATTLDNDIFNGDGTGNKLTGLKSKITTNKVDNTGQVITSKKTIDKFIRQIMLTGGNPTCLVTTANVQMQLEEILYPNVTVMPETEMAFGYQVTKYLSPSGMYIPIIVDNHLSTGSNTEELYALTEREIRLKQLMPPTLLPVPTSKLATSDVLASFDYLQVRREQRNGRMYNIGTA